MVGADDGSVTLSKTSIGLQGGRTEQKHPKGVRSSARTIHIQPNFERFAYAYHVDQMNAHVAGNISGYCRFKPSGLALFDKFSDIQLFFRYHLQHRSKYNIKLYSCQCWKANNVIWKAAGKVKTAWLGCRWTCSLFGSHWKGNLMKSFIFGNCVDFSLRWRSNQVFRILILL